MNLRALPSVDRLATAVARAQLADERERLLAGGSAIAPEALVESARQRLGAGTGLVLNATGVVLHTNLGRAPLPVEAQAAVLAAAAGYSALELDLVTGRRAARGRRAQSCLQALTGAPDALVVNNGAGAVLLAVAALAGRDRSVLVSRGEMVEIGGGFRIADVVAQSGARLVEVGSTNRTLVADYVAAVDADTAAILRVHQSNFAMSGYVARPSLRELVGLGVAVIDDIGSGALDEHPAIDAGEPSVRASVAAGAALTVFSGDKLLGGPQAGILLGGHEAVEACRRHPLSRALRLDKLSLAALEATLELHLTPDRAAASVPVLRMLGQGAQELERRADELASLTGGTRIEMAVPVGGGSLPLHELPGPAVVVDPGAAGADRLTRALRGGEPPVIALVREDQVVFNVRTLLDEDCATVAAALERARRRPPSLDAGAVVPGG